MAEPSLSRRHVLMGAGALSLAPATAAFTSPSVAGLPARDAFDFQGTYFNAAYAHPMSRRVAAAIADYTRSRQHDVTRAWTDDNPRDGAVAQFAALVNARPESIAVVPSTMTGENLVGSALGLGDDRGVVTDGLHYFGSLALYGELHQRGMPLTVVAPREGVTRPEDIARAIGPKTKLVAVSLISSLTGGEIALAEIVRIAHARGVMVYADIIQAAGAVPIDVTASGVDFCACGGYKWLMGEFGTAFLYVRPDRLSELKRGYIGWRQVDRFVEHVMPYDPPGDPAGEYTLFDTVAGHFEVGTPSYAALAGLTQSIADLRTFTVDAIWRHRQPLIDRLRAELPAKGLKPVTPADAKGPIITFAVANAARMAPMLKQAGIKAQIAENRVRISPSVYNGMADVERLIAAMPTLT